MTFFWIALILFAIVAVVALMNDYDSGGNPFE